jgi:hypothetical protein
VQRHAVESAKRQSEASQELLRMEHEITRERRAQESASCWPWVAGRAFDAC